VALKEYDATMEASLLDAASSSKDFAALTELSMTPQGIHQWLHTARHYEAMAHGSTPPPLQAHVLRTPQMMGRIAGYSTPLKVLRARSAR
jgi:hypothetical protein